MPIEKMQPTEVQTVNFGAELTPDRRAGILAVAHAMRLDVIPSQQDASFRVVVSDAEEAYQFGLRCGRV